MCIHVKNTKKGHRLYVARSQLSESDRSLMLRLKTLIGIKQLLFLQLFHSFTLNKTKSYV